VRPYFPREALPAALAKGTAIWKINRRRIPEGGSNVNLWYAAPSSEKSPFEITFPGAQLAIDAAWANVWQPK